MLTFDLDFGEILAASAGKIVNVVLFRLRNTRAHFVIQRLDDVLNHPGAPTAGGRGQPFGNEGAVVAGSGSAEEEVVAHR